MTTVIMFHEVNNAEIWANAWKEGSGSRQELLERSV